MVYRSQSAKTADCVWNVPLDDVIVWLNTTSVEDDQRLYVAACLATPTDSRT